MNSRKESAINLRCLVGRGDDSYSADTTFGHSLHFPEDFDDAPARPSEGVYEFKWFGYVNRQPPELFLAGSSFSVNANGQFHCKARGGAKPEPAELASQAELDKPRNALQGPWFEPSEVADEPTPRHRQVGDEIELAIKNLPPIDVFSRLVCEVEAPNETMKRIPVAPWSSTSANTFYPFEGAPPLMDGPYSVVWLISSIAAVIVGARQIKDAFTIEDGRLVR